MNEILPGPAALFLCGMDREQSVQPLKILTERSGMGNPNLIYCTESMLNVSLETALTAVFQDEPAAPDKLPSVCLFSGISIETIKSFLDDFRTTKLPRPIFATTTSHNLKMMVKELLLHLLEERKIQTGG